MLQNLKERKLVLVVDSIIGYNSEGEQLQYHFYALYFPIPKIVHT
jgi:hypothetical protein